VQLRHVPVPLHLRLVAVDAPFRLASEGKEVIVDELGRQAVASVLLGSLDVIVRQVLGLELLVTTLVGAGEWTLASVIHHVQLEVGFAGKRTGAARMGAGKARRHSRMLRCDMPLQAPDLCKCCSTVSADAWPLAQMNCAHVPVQVTTLLEKLPTGYALERMLSEVDSLVVRLHVALLAEDLVARGVGARELLTKMHFAVVSHHGALGREQFEADGIGAWNLAPRRPLLVANIAR